MEWMYFWSKFAVLLPDYLLFQRKWFLYKGYSSGNFQWKLMREGGQRSISRKEKYGEFFQWKSWSSEMCEHVTVKGRSTRLFL